LNKTNSRIFISFGKIVLKSFLVELTKEQKIRKKGKRRDFADSVKIAVLVIQRFKCKRCRNILTVVDFHHIDGNRSNNHISNCQALCPNCHARKTRNESYFQNSFSLGLNRFYPS